MKDYLMEKLAADKNESSTGNNINRGVATAAGALASFLGSKYLLGVKDTPALLGLTAAGGLGGLATHELVAGSPEDQVKADTDRKAKIEGKAKWLDKPSVSGLISGGEGYPKVEHAALISGGATTGALGAGAAINKLKNLDKPLPPTAGGPMQMMKDLGGGKLASIARKSPGKAKAIVYILSAGTGAVAGHEVDKHVIGNLPTWFN